MKIFAQENIAAVVKKYETAPSIAIDHMLKRNPQTKKVEEETISITVFGAAPVNEFIAAINKDKEKAFKISESTMQGKLRSGIYYFADITYTFRFIGGSDNKKESDSK